MPLGWMKVDDLSFNALLLLERVQIGWLPQTGDSVRRNLAVALRGNPVVDWYLRHKCPDIAPWLDGILHGDEEPARPPDVRAAEIAVMRGIEDWLVYVVDPSIYDAQPFLGWNSAELTSLVDFQNKTVIDVGSGTGRLALVAAPDARAVFAVEPIENLRRYLTGKVRAMGYAHVYAIDGLAEQIPLPDGTADVTLSGHVFGRDPEAEHREMCRVTRSGGMLVHCPGTSVRSPEEIHRFLVDTGYQWSIYEEPKDGPVRKYWKTI